MLISQKSKDTIDSCRFCWMCRHICPVGIATGQERNGARARALALSIVERGAKFNQGLAENLYECGLCGACTNECVTGWDPVMFTKEARLEAALEGKTPDYIKELLQKLEATGNIYGRKEMPNILAKAIESLPHDADTLLFLGQDTIARSPQSALNAIELLRKANVSFTVLPDEPDSGYALDALVGRAEETRSAMQKTAERLSKYKIVIAYDPADAKVFLREYKEWQLLISARVYTFTGFVNELIERGELKPEKTSAVYTIQDPCLLSRDLDETAPLRSILEHCGEIREMLLHGKNTMWPGNLLMEQYLPDVVRGTAATRWKNALATGADALVTASPAEYEVLKKEKPESMELLSIEQVVMGSIKLEKAERFERVTANV